MFAVASEAPGPHPFPMESVVSLKHAFGASPELKYRQVESGFQVENERRQTIGIELPSPRASQVKVDNDSVRKKLRDSLTSALEMVVSKQLVKSVLGVGKDMKNETPEEVSADLQTQVNVEGAGLEVERLQEFQGTRMDQRQDAVSMDIDGIIGNGLKVEEMETDAHTGFNLVPENCSLSTDESPLKKLKSGRESVGPVGEETKGGLKLMEQAKKVAWDVESHLFSLNGGVNKKYKEKARSLLFNLKDKSNPELRARVFNGEITPQILVRMSGEQLASKELSQWRSAKAEEFASMVVLTDADVDPRRIVKKTHKGEFQVVVDEADLSPSVDSVVARPSFPAIAKKESDEGKEGEISPGNISKGHGRSTAFKTMRVKDESLSGFPNSPTPNSEGLHDHDILGQKTDGVGGVLPTIVSLDEYIDNRDDPTSERGESLHTPPSVYGTPSDKATTMGSQAGFPENGSLKQSFKGAETGRTSVGSLSKKRERDGGVLWEGSIQLSATRFAPLDGIFRGGERLELKDWPKSVEVKGRVRLGALDKFLQDLQLSRSRTVTVLSICPSDVQGDLKQARGYLKEMADQYRMGDRAGFVEPSPGFELYLLAPGSASLELLGEHLRSINNATVEREDEVLVGVVVWRRTQSQGATSTRGPDQNVSLKKVSLSSLVSESPTKVNATPLHWTETPSSGGALPASLKTASAPSLVNVSGNSSMHSTQSHGNSLATRDHSTRRDWQQPSSAASGIPLTSVVTPTIRVTENGRGAMVDSLSLPHQSVELEDVPPGFLPRPMQTFPQGRSAAVHVDSNEHVFQPPFPGSGPGLVSLVSDRSRESAEPPPGFWPRPSVKVPPVLSQRTHTASHDDDDDDDLPEFNFEAEAVMVPRSTANQFPSVQSQFLSRQNQNAAASVLGALHTSDAGGRFQGHSNAHDPHPPLDFQSVPSGVHLRHHQDEPFAARPLHHGAALEGWAGGEVRVRETVQSLNHDAPRSLPALNGTEPRSLSMRIPRDEIATREEEFRQYSHESQRSLGHEQQQRVLGPHAPGTYGFPSPRTPFASGVRDSLQSAHLPRSELPDWRSSSMVQQPGQQRPTLPSPVSFDQPLHIRQQPPPVHMVLQHSTLKNASLPNWARVPSLPQQEARYDQRQGGVSSMSKWQQSGSASQMHYRSQSTSRKLEPRESSNDKERFVENTAKETQRPRGRDRSRVRERSRERSLSPSPERDRGHDRRGSRSLTPSRDPSPSKDSRAHPEPSSESREVTKPAKRERERDQ